MASAAVENKSENASPVSVAAESSGGGGGKLVLILSAVNTVVTVAMVAILFISFQKEKKQPRVEDIAAGASAAKEDGGKKGEKGEESKAEKGGEGKEAAPKRDVEFGKMVTLEQFTVNLSTPGSAAPKFARVNVSLEVPNEDAEAEINAKIPQVRNVIIDLFNSKRASDLATAEGRDYLKEEIKNALNGFLVHGKVRGVYFTNFALAG